MKFYRELEHTADWAIEVWGDSVAALFAHAAEALFEMQGAELGAPPIVEQHVVCQATDVPALLVTWLNELLFLSETLNVLFTHFEPAVSTDPEPRVTAQIRGVPGRGHMAHVKAVTYYKLVVEPSPEGWRATVTFDT